MTGQTLECTNCLNRVPYPADAGPPMPMSREFERVLECDVCGGALWRQVPHAPLWVDPTPYQVPL